jgi:AcrR family transcriptional regulator
MTERVRRAKIASTPRPRDRKEQIITAAGELFYRRGFHNVGTEDIAQSVGITAGALYRHFKGKQDLLAHTLTDVFDAATTLVVDASATSLDEMIHGLAVTAGGRRDLGILWNREARHLDPERRSAMRERFFAFLEQFAIQLHKTRPELSEEDADLLSWCALGVLTSPSYHRTEISAERMVTLLEAMTMAVVTTPLDRERGPAREAPAPGLQPSSRREAILAQATRLFYEHGFQAVTMDDVGSAVGMTSAGVYKYFPSKAELLSAVISRASEPLQLGLTQALAGATTDAEGLMNALDAYVEFAAVHHDLVGILVSEVTNLPDAHRHSVRRAQHDYVAEWVRLLRGTRPELSDRTARFLVHALLTVVNDVTRTSHLLQRSTIRTDLELIGRRLLATEV